MTDFTVVLERDFNGCYVASGPALPGCQTQARSLDGLRERVREAIQLCLEVQEPGPETPDFEGVYRISVEE